MYVTVELYYTIPYRAVRRCTSNLWDPMQKTRPRISQPILPTASPPARLPTPGEYHFAPVQMI